MAKGTKPVLLYTGCFCNKHAQGEFLAIAFQSTVDTWHCSWAHCFSKKDGKRNVSLLLQMPNHPCLDLLLLTETGKDYRKD